MGCRTCCTALPCEDDFVSREKRILWEAFSRKQDVSFGKNRIGEPVVFRKEVIQPQVLLRLPCYDFTPIMNHTLGRCSPALLSKSQVGAQTSSAIHFRDVTGGVYKARERIHGSVLICHY